MSGILVYPRLPAETARQLLAVVRDAAAGGIESVSRLAATSHPKAAPVATGGREASADDVIGVRAAVLEAVGTWVRNGSVPRPQQPLFDARLGKALYEALRIMPADAAHSGTWNFLTLVVLPDVAVTRFGDLADERGLGSKRERNVLSRAWMRWEALGNTLLAGDPPLGEDELVGLLERTSVARNRVLVHELAVAVLTYTGAARSEFARELYKLVRRRTGPLMLDVLSAEELAALVKNEAAKLGHHVDWQALTPSPTWMAEFAERNTPPTDPVVRRAPADAVTPPDRTQRERDGEPLNRPGVSGDSGVETLVCQTCGRPFQRARTRGRKPYQCPDCRERAW